VLFKTTDRVCSFSARAGRFNMDDFETWAGITAAIVFGVVFIYMSMSDKARLVKTKFWPTTNGEVIFQHYNGSKIEKLKNPPPSQVSHLFATLSTKHRALWLQYEYTVDGKKYTNDNYSIGDAWITADELMKAKREFCLGTKVKVHYDSKNPTDSLLVIPRKVGQGALIGGLFLLCMGLYCIPVVLGRV